MHELGRFVWKDLLVISSKCTFWGLPGYSLGLSRSGNVTDAHQLTGKEKRFCQNSTFIWNLESNFKSPSLTTLISLAFTFPMFILLS